MLSFGEMARIHARAFSTRPWSAVEIESLSALPGFVHSSAHGFCIGRITGKQAELLTIAIDPAAQGRGEGARLLQEFVTTICEAGVQVAFLEVGESNSAAISLYKRYGWSEIARRPRYYRHADGTREAALVLHLQVESGPNHLSS